MFSMKGKLYAWLASAAAFVLGVFAIYNKGRKDVETEHMAEEQNEYINTRKRMDKVDMSDDADAARERLRNRTGTQQR